MKRTGEKGYAVLMVFAMAAMVAISLYMELPRAAFEAQRDKEQMLIDRGEQYSRAIQLYVRKFNRFPPDFDALNNTQGIRFLRKKYIDPMTDKDEWRVIHAGPGGVLTDSKIQPQKKSESGPQNFITEMQQVGGGVEPGTPDGVNLATRRRASDQPGAPGDPNAPPGAGGPADPARPPGPGAVQVMPDGRIVPVIGGSQNAPLPQGVPGQAFPGQPGFPGQVGAPPQLAGQQFGQSAQQFGQPGPPPAAAANLINQILTTPRGLPGQPTAPVDQFGNALPQGGVTGGIAPQGGFGTPIQAAAGQQVIGGGIAGVASKREQEGIKIYNGRTTYDEWEFVYDISKDKMRTGGGSITGSAPGVGQPIQQPTGQGFGQPIGQPLGAQPQLQPFPGGSPTQQRPPAFPPH